MTSQTQSEQASDILTLVARRRALMALGRKAKSSIGPAPAAKRGNRRPSKFKQSDVQRVLAAAAKSGAKVALEITPDGTIRLVPASETIAAQSPPDNRRIVL